MMAIYVKIMDDNKYEKILLRLEEGEECPEKHHLEALVEMDCSYEGATPKYICIDIPEAVELSDVSKYHTENNIQWEYVAPTYTELNPNAG